MKLLGSIKTGKQDGKPPRVLLYGEAGVGKSTFASEWPDALFIDAEKRLEHLDVARFEPSGWLDILRIMNEVANDESKTYKTIVFDTIDHIELLIYDHLCKQDNVASIEEYGKGYGKGYMAARDEWRRLVHAMEVLRDRGITCLLLAHGHVKTFRNPEGEDFDRWCLKINAKSANFLREKMDVLAFARFQDFGKDGKGHSTGDRIMSCYHNPAFESKAGLSMPEEDIELSYEAFQEALKGEE